MASFDFIDAASKGYEFVWDRRGYLTRLLIPVIFIKVVCLLCVFVLHAQDKFLLQGLILLPASFLEAVFITGLVRFMVFAEPIYVWGRSIPLADKDQTCAKLPINAPDRKRFMQVGIATYLLAKILATGFAGALLDHAATLQNMPPPDIAPLNPVFATLLFIGLGAGLIWLFRLGWFFIPASMGYPLRPFMKKIAGMRISFYLILTYLICLLPIMTVFAIILNILAGILSDGSAAFIIARALFEALTEMSMLSIQTVAITYGINEILFGKTEEK